MIKQLIDEYKEEVTSRYGCVHGSKVRIYVGMNKVWYVLAAAVIVAYITFICDSKIMLANVKLSSYII